MSILGRRKIKCKVWRLKIFILRHEETIETFSPRFMLYMRMDWRKATLQQNNNQVKKNVRILVKTTEVLSHVFYIRNDSGV